MRAWILGGGGGERRKRKHSRCEPWDKKVNEFSDTLRIPGAEGREGLIAHLYCTLIQLGKWGTNNNTQDRIADVLIISR